MFNSNLTGGPAWHWQAWRSEKAWAPTVDALETWLLAQTTPETPRTLLLIGASAGWMMPHLWLQQFKEIHTFDIDPLAGHLFKWRHGKKLQAHGVRLACLTQNALANLPALLKTHPQACVFFDNVLGQLRFNSTDIKLVEKNMTRCVQALKGREWGSVHDRMSGPVSGDLALSLAKGAALPQTSGHLDKGEDAQKWLTSIQAQSPWLDHLTGKVFEREIAVHNMAWAFKPNYWHWLQAGWVKP
jgi:hypothetical protein